MRDYFPDTYIKDRQQKSIEEVIKYLNEQGKDELVQPILDLMRMSENWYGRLDERRGWQDDKGCLHKNCPGCKNGTCDGVHTLSCPCRSCSPTM